MFQRKIDNIFRNGPNLFDIADDILIVGYDDSGADHNRMLLNVLDIQK